MSNLYQELLWRGMIKECSNEELAVELLNNKKTKFYCGFDPTGKSLTVGHLVQIVRIRLLQLHGHIPYVLVGGATGLIGDPRQSTERNLLSIEESLANAELIKKQLLKTIDKNNAYFVNNYDWIKNISTIEFLRDFGKSFGINYMISKDLIQKRLETGISFTEFSYTILQAIDFWHLYTTEDVKIQFGGSDQWGNITSGLELIRKRCGDSSQALGLSSPLLLKADGTKFGKSESGALWLDENLTTPYELYQYFINVADSDLENYLKLLTLLSQNEIQLLLKFSKSEPEKRLAQIRLAEEIVKFVHGNDALESAKRCSDALFSGEFSLLNDKEFEYFYKGIGGIEIHKNNNALVIDLLLEANLVKSKREARDFIMSSAISINKIKLDNIETRISSIPLFNNRYAVLQRGKKKFAIIRVS